MSRLLWCLVALAAWAGCSDPSQEKLPWRAPIWGEPPGDRILMQAEPLSLGGDARQVEPGQARFAGFRVYGGRFTRLRLVVRPLEAGVDPVVALYGPRRDGEIWGRPLLVLDDDAPDALGVNLEGFTLPQRGEYLIMVGYHPQSEPGPLELALACEDGCEGVVPCPSLSCLEEPCERGWRNDARGCRSCECLDECDTSADCPSDQICVGRQCRGDCICADDVAPVCGVDGQTYANACEARCLNIEVLTAGACPQECPALDCAQSCAAGYRLGEDGCPICACRDLCELCEERINPVCTRNGTTAPNACLAQCQGEEVAYAGRCLVDCSPLICELECPGDYLRDADGCEICECFNEPCVEDGRFVCGVNGVTYDSECEAERAGVEIALRGACPRLCDAQGACLAPLECQALGGCQVGQEGCVGVCSAPQPLLCDQAGACLPGFTCQEGVCVLSCDCSPLFDPVCGVDDQTYLNPCVARCGRVGVVKAGACCGVGALDGCMLECENGFALDADDCEICACREVPPCECSPVENPVCGADQRTYRNSCQAQCAGQRQWQEGACL